MKKICTLLLLVCMLFCLVACGADKTTNIDVLNNLSQIQTSEPQTDESTTTESTDNVQTNSNNNDETTSAPTENQKPAETTNLSHVHYYSEATCTKSPICSCGAENGQALGHSWNNATCTSAKKCSRCEETNGSALGHSFSQGKCSRCNVSDPNYSAVSISKQNALEKAKSYLKYSAFSYLGLVDQLEYEEFSHEDAVYGVDNCGADWNEQALEKAKSYLKYSAFSYSGLIDQLEYEEFTAEQAKYGVDNCGANWNEQAAKKAESYLGHPP